MDRARTSRGFYIAGVAVAFIVLTAAITNAEERPTLAIKIDQIGYLPSASKLAVVTSGAQKFTVKRASDHQTVFEGELTASVKDSDTGDTVQQADFSSLYDSGDYYLEIPGVGRSWTFAIRPDTYSRPAYLALRAFYAQRCGVAVDLGPEFPGYVHQACHRKGAFHPSSGKPGVHDGSGGWHDAGDYGRYMPSSSLAAATLMWAWEFYAPELKSIRLDIPESGNGTPDILNETRWGLEWMLAMQDADGGVWHKQTSEKFSGFVMPEADTATSEVIGTGSKPFKNTCATADLAAVGAIAARVYKPYDASFAARSLAAARKAWRWAKKHPNVSFKNPTGIETGEYGDSDCGDERLWAAAELWRTTGEPEFNKFVVTNYANYLDAIASPAAENWAQMAPFAVWTYLLADRNEARRAVAQNLRARVQFAAETIVTRTRRNPYRVSLRADDYVWGSNGNVAQYGMQLLVADRLSPNPAFVDAAADNLHYLLGRNTFSRSFVTQVGANPVRNPHHRPSVADSKPEPWPGLVAGGPNAKRQDEVLRALPDLPPARMYADDGESYASNEVAINWQAMLVFLLAGHLK